MKEKWWIALKQNGYKGTAKNDEHSKHTRTSSLNLHASLRTTTAGLLGGSGISDLVQVELAAHVTIGFQLLHESLWNKE